MTNISVKPRAKPKPKPKAKPKSDARRKRPTLNPVESYARGVSSGKILAGPAVRGECQRFLDDLKGGAARGLSFDPERAQWAIDFFADVLTVEAENKTIAFELLDWQAFCVGSIFGWYLFDPELKKKVRRFQTAYIETGKGSGKSPLAAGVGLYCMIADGVASAEVYAAATIKSQAMILFKDATNMIKRSPDLKDRLSSSGGNPVWQWTHIESASIFKPLSKDEAVSGPRPNCALIDEYHEHKTADAMEMLEAGFKGRDSPLLFVITNSGKNKVTPCGDMHDYAYSVATGAYDSADQSAADRFFSYISMLDRDDDPFADEECWPKANPSLGHTIKKSYLRKRVNAAKAMPSKQNDVLRLNFCRWTDSDTAWMTNEIFQKLLTKEDLRAKCKGMKAYGGSDLSFTTDLTSTATVIPYHVGDVIHYFAFVDSWRPREGLQAAVDKDKVRYDVWAKEGDLHLTGGRVVDMGAIADHYNGLATDFDLQAIAFDAYRHRELEKDLRRLGYEIPLIEHPQGFRRQMKVDPLTHKKVENPLWMPGSCQELENAFIEGRITIQYNRVLNWNVSSAVIRQNPAGTGDWHFDKAKATARIDGLVALAMAVGAAKAGVTGDVLSDPWEDENFSMVE
jgi:phage terminase large subunit-like protein